MNQADGLRRDAQGVMALPRYAHDSEIAALISYLASPEAGFITRASLTIDGDFSA